jgi:hypothetical protein
VAEFLSDEWLGELAAAVAGYEGFDSLTAEVVIEQVVHLEGGGELRYRVRLFPGGGEVTTGPSLTTGRAADLVLVTDAATARELHRGRRRAQDALAGGGLKVRGRPERIALSADALAALSAASAPVRARTTYAGESEEATGGEQ